MIEGALRTDCWLPMTLPADGETFSTTLADVAESLVAAGATVVESTDADALVVPTPPSVGHAKWLVVTDFSGLESHETTLVGKLGQRARASARSAALARAATRALAAQRYARIDVLRWDFDVDGSLRANRLARKEEIALPRASAVVARDNALSPTIWERAEAEAAALAELRTPSGTATLSASGLAMHITDDTVFRCAVGRASDHILDGARTIERLRRFDTPRSLARLVPRFLGDGRSGIGRWTLERRIAGQTPSSLTPQLSHELIGLIGEMFTALADGARDTVTGYARVIERATGTRAAAIVAHAPRVDHVLDEVPRGFAHGDLWRENLILSDSRLVGIIDWVRASDGKFPLGDFLHLSTCERDYAGQPYGVTVARELLPWARAGGDDAARGLCRRIGFEPTAEILEALVLAYWYDRTASELTSYRDRVRSTTWLESNVDTLEAVLAHA